MTQGSEGAEQPTDIEGYVADSLYPSLYHPAFAPLWIDTLLLRESQRPPRGTTTEGTQPFTMLDIGCGDGLGLIVNAALHPESRFIGIDAMATHIERGNAAIGELGLDNVDLRCATFSEALDHSAEAADYIAVQGVLSWVSAANRHDLLRLIARNLKPGGVVAIGYNAMPGWSPFLTFQKTLRSLSLDIDGSPTERFAGAYELMRALSGAGMAELGERHFDWMDDLREKLPEDYFPHEYLNGHWQPLWSNDVAKQAEDAGLHFVRGAMPHRLRDDFSLKAAQRAALEAVEDIAARELAIDLYLNSQFRIDIFQKAGGEALTDDDATAARLDGYWLLKRDPERIDYTLETPAGTLRFDNIAARHIVSELNGAAKKLSDIAGRSGECTDADILNAVDALFAAGHIVPGSPPNPGIAVDAINSWIAGGENGKRRINAMLTPHGAIAASHG